jgi:streptomycin 3"-adenylyltransferase
MKIIIPDEISKQVISATEIIQRHLPQLQSIYLYGSAIDGGLKPNSDIDLLVIVENPPSAPQRQTLLLELLKVSAPPGEDKFLRALEVTVVSQHAVVPWKYPAKRELQFGEWLRKDLFLGIFEPPMLDHDLAILLTKIRQHSIALYGPEAVTLLDPVPEKDFLKALLDTVSLWNSPEDWAGEEQNIVLALARIWFSAATGRIESKDAAAMWLLGHIPEQHCKILELAKSSYLQEKPHSFSAYPEQVESFILFAKDSVTSMLEKRGIVGATA